jgi:hypothetical protein
MVSNWKGKDILIPEENGRMIPGGFSIWDHYTVGSRFLSKLYSYLTPLLECKFYAQE